MIQVKKVTRVEVVYRKKVYLILAAFVQGASASIYFQFYFNILDEFFVPV